MKLCWLGLHKWGKWEVLPKLMVRYTRPEHHGHPLSDWQMAYNFKYQKRECEDCGRTETDTVRWPEE